MSKRGGGGGIATVTRGLCDAYCSKMIKGIKTNQPEVKASKSDKRLRSYGHFKFLLGFVSVYNECRRLLDVAQTPTCKNFDIPEQSLHHGQVPIYLRLTKNVLHFLFILAHE